MKTRRKKINKSPLHPFGGRTARPRVYVVAQGDRVTTTGFRGRTLVKRIVTEEGRRVNTVRLVEDKTQVPAKAVGDRKPIGIWLGRTYTGVGRSKAYPYRSSKRGEAPLALKPRGLMAGAAKAVGGFLKRVTTKPQTGDERTQSGAAS